MLTVLSSVFADRFEALVCLSKTSELGSHSKCCQIVIFNPTSVSDVFFFPCRQDREAEVQQLVSEMRAEGERHKRELETVRQRCRREVEDAQRRAVSQCKSSQNASYTEMCKMFQGVITLYMHKITPTS